MKFAYSSDVLCMIDLFCLFALSPRSHIKANFTVLHNKRCTHERMLKDYLYEAFTSSYLPRYPCHLSRAFQSLHRIPALSILTGRCSARRSDRGRTSRCCCTARGSRLSTYHVYVKQPSKEDKGNQEEKQDCKKGALRVDRVGAKMGKDSTE